MTAEKAIAYIKAAAKSAELCRKRGELPSGASRARVTTANARWANHAEERDRLGKDLPDEFTTAVMKHLNGSSL